MKVGLIIGIFLIVSTLLVTIIIGIYQEKTYDTSMNCDELRECVLLDINCLDKYVQNSFFMLEWEFYTKVRLSEQKEYYIKECMYKDGLE